MRGLAPAGTAATAGSVQALPDHSNRGKAQPGPGRDHRPEGPWRRDLTVASYQLWSTGS
jgi:hypothetical protein